MKFIAIMLIMTGVLFTTGMFYILFTVEDSFDIVIGWLFLGPLPLILGVLILKKYYLINFFKFFRKIKK